MDLSGNEPVSVWQMFDFLGQAGSGPTLVSFHDLLDVLPLCFCPCFVALVVCRCPAMIPHICYFRALAMRITIQPRAVLRVPQLDHMAHVPLMRERVLLLPLIGDEKLCDGLSEVQVVAVL